jgi:glycosyltransferase involved in cell wall biosynthesis
MDEPMRRLDDTPGVPSALPVYQASENSVKRSGILHLTPFYLFPENPGLWNPRFDPLGGMHLLTHVMANELCRRGANQIVLTMGLPGAPTDYCPRPNMRVISRRYVVPPIRSKLEGYFGLVMSFAVASFAWVSKNRHALRSEIGLVHVHCDGSGSVPWLGLNVARILDVPLVMHIHSCRNLTQVPTTLWERVVDPVAKRSELECITAASRIVTLTDRLRSVMLDQLGLSPRKVEQIVFPAHPDLRSGDSAAGRSQVARMASVKSSKPLITYLGRISVEKGVDTFVEMARLLSDRDYEYLLVGDGPELNAIRARVTEAGLGSRFHYTGFLPPDLVASAIAQAAVGVVPSRYEEFGLVIAEFMQMQIPVIASDVGGVRETVRHEINGLLVPPGDASATAEAVRRIMDDPPTRDRLVAQGYVDTRDLTVSKGVSALIRVYADLAPATVDGLTI